MRRGYTAGQYRSLVDRARELISGLSMTTDLIVGFPGETEDDFQHTLEMIQTVEFDDAFTFQYSPRPGTDAVKWPGQVPSAVRHERLERLIDRQRQITQRVNERMVGQTVEVLVEGRSKRDAAELMGRTRGNKVVIFPGDAELVGHLVPIRITSVRAATARGTIFSESTGRPPARERERFPLSPP
jgi:tRNA-2-methylthio-N6-dimethylallyladenosine synthase